MSMGVLPMLILALVGIVFNVAMIICVIIATVSLVRIARSHGELVVTITDLKRELEEVKEKLKE